MLQTLSFPSIAIIMYLFPIIFFYFFFAIISYCEIQISIEVSYNSTILSTRK